MELRPYLIFPGTCREALDFYADALKGEVVELQTVAESPLPWDAEHGERIFNSLFVAGDVRFMASDGEPGRDPAVGENVVLFLTFADAGTQSRAFEALSDGGTVMMPLADGFGMIRDRFGIGWMLALEHG